MNKSKSIPFCIVIGIIIFALSGCNFPSRSRVGLEISNPTEGQSILLGQETQIVSVAGSTKGIKAVEVYINGELLNIDVPLSGSPKQYTSNQPWTPTEEGDVIISIVAKDSKDNASEPVSIVVKVVQSISEIDVTPSPTVDDTSEALPQTQTPTEETACTNSASFIDDITIPDNSVVAAGSSFTKIWRIRNTGTCDWVSYEFVHASGQTLGSSTVQALPVISSTSVADISVDLVAPTTPGTYTTSWRIRAADGTVFGPELFVTFIIPSPATNTPIATVTPTSTATTGVLSVQQYSESISIPGSGTEHTTVTCPAGSVVVSGGFATSVDVRVWHQTKDGNGWRVYATNTNTSNRQIEIFAHCLHNSGGTTDVVMTQVYVDPNDKTQLTAACPSGSQVTGGAWVIGSDPDISLYNSSPSGNGWQIWVDNTAGGSPLINVYAVCLSGASGSTSYVTNTGGVIPPGDYEILEKACNSGTYATGGGYAVNIGAVIYNTSLNGNAWKNSARNDTATQKLMYTYAMCYSP